MSEAAVLEPKKKNPRSKKLASDPEAKPKAAKPALEGLPFDSFSTVEMWRSELKSAEYNPRQINDEEKKRLRAGLKKHKMVQPPTWNKRTGILVGGHQRLTQLDALAGGADYRLQVAVIDVSEIEEREINLLLNNPQSQGDWDLAKLEALLKDPKIDLAGTGFDMADVYQLFGADTSNSDSVEMQMQADNLRELKDKYKANIAKAREKGNTDFYIVVVFRDADHRSTFLSTLGLDDNRYQDGRRLLGLLQAAERKDGCTWTGCDGKATHSQETENDIWAELCDEHDAELNKELASGSQNRIISATLRAIGGAELFGKRLAREVPVSA